MTFDVNIWLEELTNRLKAAFGPRLKAVGLQGSFARGEATPHSDIDAVVILDTLSPQDITAYRQILSQMPSSPHPTCGFLGGAQDLRHWFRAELFQFGLDTRLCYGTLDGLVPPPTRGEARLAAQMGAGTLYHLLVHTWVHGTLTPEFLRQLAKPAFFMLQAAHFVQTGEYLPGKNQLLQKLNRPPLSLLLPALENAAKANLEEAAKTLLTCCQQILAFSDDSSSLV